MKHAIALAFAACAALAGTARAVDVFKWTDSKGVVHYGDRPASGVAASTVSVPGGGASDEEIAAAQASLDADRARLEQPSYEPYYRYRVRRQPVQPTATSACESQWRAYEASQACFNAHREYLGRGVNDRGVAVCHEMAQPSCSR
ncbi:DUF4124 domain-containing protein [Scleromatobacter humisilvae]|uniref:DUF4124 domain-containing protein n=1 Tax=Scleromatobacter humisilvae TaxID=2897159 RepID=A0A9X2C215_9BURK|nr:DUF4124 domain-containing protein [Scleromatobacter humisilvae]MCK9685565.1 DUF4124 domain-containing protein [Scleromatobacter humisilvae]